MKKLSVLLLLLAGNVSAVEQTVMYDPALGWLVIPVIELPDETTYYDVIIDLSADGKYTILSGYLEPSAPISEVCTEAMITPDLVDLLKDNTLEEANQIIGCRGKFLSGTTFAGTTLKHCIWEVEGTFTQIRGGFTDEGIGGFSYFSLSQ